MPGAHQVERERRGQIDAEEVGDLGAIVLGGRTDDRLEHEQSGHHEEEPGACALGRRKRDVARRPEAQGRLLAAVPAKEVPASERAEEQADSSQQRDQGQHRPDDHVRGRLVVHPRFGRPVVRVAVVVPRPFRGGRPRRPAEEGRQRREISAVGDGVGAEAVLGRRLREETGVAPHEQAVGDGLRASELEDAGVLVVAVRPERLDCLPAGRVGARAAIAAADEVGGAPQVVGRVVGAQVGAVAEDRSVLHETVVEEHLLAALDVPLGVDRLARWVDHPIRDRRLGLVGAIGQQTEHEEPREDDEHGRLQPAPRYQQAPPLLGHSLLLGGSRKRPQYKSVEATREGDVTAIT